MKFLRNILFLIAIGLLLPCEVAAQDAYVDSLRHELAVSYNDSTKIVLYGYLVDYYSQYDNDIADKYADTVLYYSYKCKSDKLCAIAYCGKGCIKNLIGDYSASIKYYGFAEYLAKKIQDSLLLCLIYTEYGNIYNSKNNELAISYYNKAIEECKKIGDNESYADLLVNIATLYYADANYDKIIMLYDSALNITSNRETKVAIYNNLAYLQYLIGNKQEAMDMYSYMLSLIDENTDIYIYVSAINDISGIYIQEGEYSKAFDYLSEVDSICSINALTDIKLALYQNYHDLYVRTGDFKLAHYYLEQYNALNDSIYGVDFSETLKELEVVHLRERNELEMKHRDEEIRFQKTINLILCGVVALVVVFVVIIAFMLVRKSRLNKMLNMLNSDLKQRDEEISSNLEYAREIQLGCMSNSLMESNLQMFVLDRPKVVVGGDFYISQTKGVSSYVVVGDCTGHGISGGFLSVLGIKSVYEAIEKYDTLPEMASFINNEFCEIVSSAENLKGESLCLSMLRICGNELRFLGSKQKMWIVSVDKGDCSTARPLACKPEVHEYKSANAIMGNSGDEVFKEEIVTVKSGDVVFLSSDGYPDQFGKDGKLKYSRFRNLLLECSQMKPDKAREFLSEKLDLWRGELEQTDDVTIVGVYF